MQADILIIESRTKPKVKVSIQAINYPDKLIMEVNRNDNLPDGIYSFSMDDELSIAMILDLLVLHLGKSTETCKALLDLLKNRIFTAF